jgi:hypothetical protein
MNITLNIGLQEGRDGPVIMHQTALAKTLHVMQHCNIKVRCFRYRVADSATEPTLILGLSLGGDTWRIVQALESLCQQLKQEAIAAYVVGRHGVEGGFLAGPKAQEWGPFNPEYFLKLDGSEGGCPLD